MLHNLLLQHYGCLDTALSPFPGGVKDKISKRCGNAWNGNDGIWNRFDDNTIVKEMIMKTRTSRQLCPHMHWQLAGLLRSLMNSLTIMNLEVYVGKKKNWVDCLVKDLMARI